MHTPRRLLRVLLLALCAAIAPAAFAAAVPWKSDKFNYIAEGKTLREVMRDFAASQGLAAVVQPGVEGSVTGKFDLTPRSFLNMMSQAYGFVWFYDGSTLIISPPSDMRSTIFTLQYVKISDLRKALTALQLEDPRYPLRFDASERTLLVAGPSRYVELVGSVTANMDRDPLRRINTITRVFPLTHAWAADRSLSGAMVPGLVTVLKDIFHSGGGKLNGASSRFATRAAKAISMSPYQSMDQQMQTLFGPPVSPSSSTSLPETGPLGRLGGEANANMQAQGIRGAQSSSATPLASPPGGNVGDISTDEEEFVDLPLITADTRTNAVVIRDRPERMAGHEALIERLDTRTQLIEIETQIVDIQDSALQQLGVEWNIQPGTDNTLAKLKSSGAKALLERIGLYQEAGRARIKSNPKVVTVENLAATMESSNDFYVPVQGYQSASLYQVRAGTSLRVIPAVTMQEGSMRIKLEIQIKDGQIGTQTVGAIPIVSSTDISTQAYVTPGETLLLGGYSVTQDSDTTAGVPGLSKMPLVGALFRHQSTTSRRLQRVFLLTPRILEP